jgi:hypothetical protein
MDIKKKLLLDNSLSIFINFEIPFYSCQMIKRHITHVHFQSKSILQVPKNIIVINIIIT